MSNVALLYNTSGIFSAFERKQLGFIFSVQIIPSTINSKVCWENGPTLKSLLAVFSFLMCLFDQFILKNSVDMECCDGDPRTEQNSSF